MLRRTPRAVSSVDDVSGVGDRAGKPVEFGDHQGVAGSAGGHRLSQTWPCSISACEAVVDVDAVGVDAEGMKPVTLGSEILPGGRHPGVPNL